MRGFRESRDRRLSGAGSLKKHCRKVFQLPMLQEFEDSYVPFLLEQRRDLEAKRSAAVEEQAQLHTAFVATSPCSWFLKVKAFERGLDRAKRGHQEMGREDMEQLLLAALQACHMLRAQIRTTGNASKA